MEKENIYDALMIKVLAGNASKAEVEQFQNWLNENPENANEYADFQKIWTTTPAISMLEKLDVEADLVTVKKKATVSEIVIGAGLYFYLNQSDTKAPIVLSDGTKVWLYQDAKLDYPAAFASDIRAVKLTGEAFFDVAKDVTKPFVIAAGATDIRVLGTSFNVQSATNTTNVIVNTGKVQLINRAEPKKLVELTKGEKGVYEKGTLEETINEDINYRSWQSGTFEFDGTVPIEEVVAQLSKYYGPIELMTTANRDCLFEGTFNKEELSTVLAVIRSSCGLN